MASLLVLVILLVKSVTRPPINKRRSIENAETYRTQIFKVLDPEKTIVRDNSEWLESMNFADVLVWLALIQLPV